MKNLHFALCGTIILLLLSALASCSFTEMDIEEQSAIEEPAENESAANEESPVTKEEESSGDYSPTDEESPDQKGDESPSCDEEEILDDGLDSSLGIPPILINELRTQYSGTSSVAEFIEFKILNAGNLGGLRVFVASNTANPLVYEFLPVKVKKGEYVVLHLRTLGNESVSTDFSSTARNFWIPGNTKRLRKTDAVYIMDQDDNVLDAVMLAENPFPPRSAAFFAATAEFLFDKGAWEGGALNSTGIGNALTRSISRDETVPDTNTAADWYITANGGVSPGKPNDPRRL